MDRLNKLTVEELKDLKEKMNASYEKACNDLDIALTEYNQLKSDVIHYQNELIKINAILLNEKESTNHNTR